VSAPLVVSQTSQLLDLSLDGSLATQEELDATNAQLLATKSNVTTLFASSAALSGEVDALAAEVAGKQGQLTPGTVADGYQVLQGTTVRALQAVAPLKIAPDTQFLQIRLDQAELAATPAIAALQTAVAGKQDVLGFVPDEDPNSYQILQNGVIRALKVSSPLVATSDMSQVHVSLDPGWSPFFCAGRVNGNTATATSSIGQVGYSVQRPSTHSTTGVIHIIFNSPAPNNNYVVHLTSMLFGTVRLWESYQPTVNGFQVVMTSTTWQLANGLFHFSVIL
jgi:hypothetical protein